LKEWPCRRIDSGIANVIEQIRDEVAADQFEFSQHAVDQSILRRITVQELRECVASGEIIED
jgi:hypothetical protein